MEPIQYINRVSGKIEVEKVYGGWALDILYGQGWWRALLRRVVKVSFLSAFYGYLQKRPSSAKQIKPFLEAFAVDPAEFLDPVESYGSFNDFFCRKLKPTARPLAAGEDVAIIPADGRYWFYQNSDMVDGFFCVKGKKFVISQLLQDRELAASYAGGAMILARLCPIDYHRFHFPCACRPHASQLINGWLASVNPVAIKHNIEIFTENKRSVAILETERFGKVAYVEVGATNVGSINQTYIPLTMQQKGAEKGFFAFGGSALVLLFEPGKIDLDNDLLQGTARGFEVRCLMGQSLGRAGRPE